MIAVIIYDDPYDDSEEIARVTIEGDVIGDSPTAEGIRDRLEDEMDPILSDITDGRELLQYIKASYSTGYKIALYDSDESARILEQFSDEEYADWRESVEYETRL